MSKQRMIRDSFWTDSYIERLSPDEKLIFLYLLTNPLSNVAGIYEIRTKRIGFETGYDIEVIENILQRFERDNKVLRFNDWIVLVNHLKNQSLNPSIIQGCQRIIDELPTEIKTRVTGWVQAGLLNLTLLNLTSLNSTLPNVAVKKEEVIIKKNEFESFWKEYPKKKGKGTAERAWLKLSPDLGEILSSIGKQKNCEQWQKSNGTFIPYPATWLNSKGWLDEVDVTIDSKFSKYDS